MFVFIDFLVHNKVASVLVVGTAMCFFSAVWPQWANWASFLPLASPVPGPGAAFPSGPSAGYQERRGRDGSPEEGGQKYPGYLAGWFGLPSKVLS